MSRTIDVAKDIVQNNELMALPEAVLQVLESVDRDEISIDSLSNIINKDPALTGRVLKIANSPFYGLAQKVISVHQAVMILGMTTVKCLTLSAAIFNREKLEHDVGIDIGMLYSNIISVAVTSRKLAITYGYSSPENAFTCGLLHDIGLLYFLHHYPIEYKLILSNIKESGAVFDEEKKQLGLTHPEAGEMIVRKWRLPENIVSAIAHHHSFGDKNSDELDDLIRLAVALNREIFAGSGHYLEDKITKIGVISSRLEISNRQLDDIALTIAKDAALFARATDIRIEDYGMILARANQEIFNTYLSIQKLFRERQELTRKLLDEERDRGLLEAKQVAISTLSHYINNAAMAISGNSQVIRMSLKHKNSDEIAATLPRVLDTMDGAVRKIAAVLEEISDLNQLDTMEYYDQSKILNIDDRIKKRMVKLEKASGVVLPDETELIVDSLTSK